MVIPSKLSILPDANIWASATLHAWFGLIAAETRGILTFYWTEDILAEAIRARRKRFPLAESAQVENIRERLVTGVGAIQIKAFPIDASVEYVDVGDAHVHSAAVFAGVDVLVTDNVSDFGSIDSVNKGYGVQTADEFLTFVAHAFPDEILRVSQLQQDYFESRGKSVNLVGRLIKAGCPDFAHYVRGL